MTNKPIYRTNFLTAALLFLLLLVTTSNIFAAPDSGELDRSFKPTILGSGAVATIRDTVVQSDGKTIVVGTIWKVNNQQVNHVARFNADGTLDATFDAGGAVVRGFFGDINVVALQPDGKIIVGGKFEQVARQPRYGLARLNADGSFDPTFNANLNANLTAALTSIAVQTDGKILVGGGDIVFNTGTNTTATRRGIVRINSDGSLESGFNPFSSSTQVNSVALQTDGKILIGGGDFAFGSQTRNQVARLNAEGSLDASFVGAAYDSSVFIVAPQANGKIYVGGAFNTIGGQDQSRLARLNADGTRDAGFASSSGNPFVKEIYTQSTGKIIYSGDGGSVYRANTDGTADTDFRTRSRVQTNAYKVNVLPDDRVIVGGADMQILTTVGGFQAETRNFVILAADGTLDDSVNPHITPGDTAGGNNYSPTVVAQPDGKVIYSSDTFFEVNRAARRNIVRLNADGSTDNTFNLPNGLIASSSRVTAMAQQADGKIIYAKVGANNATDPPIARLNTDGSRDTSFADVVVKTGASNGVITGIATLPNGQVIIKGFFTLINGQTRESVARLNADGSLDSFNPKVANDFTVSTNADGILVQPDGKFFLIGRFASASGSQVARFNADGSLDTNYNSAVGSGFMNYALQPDGKIIYAGNSGLARLNADGSPDSSFNAPTFSVNINTRVNPLVAAVMNNGKILVGGKFNFINLTTISGTPRTGFARLNADGSLDTTYGTNGGATVSGNGSNQGGNTGIVQAIALQSDGNALIAGIFQYVNNFSQPTLARLKVSATGRNNITDFDGDGRADASVFRNGNWFINPSSTNNFYGVQFGLSTDKLAPADYDGDGKTDIAVWREGAFAYFYILNSSSNTVRTDQFGQTGDVVTVGDFDGDGKADPAVYREGAQSYFYYRGSANNPNGNITAILWGTSGDKAVRGDFDGDGKLDAAVFRPSNGVWYIRNSSNGQTSFVQFGLPSDKRVSGDFDGDGKTDIAVFRDGLWIVLHSSNNQVRYQNWGASSDILTPGDYDGDGKTDFAVWRNGVYYTLSSSNAAVTYNVFGAGSDLPIASAYVR